MAGPIFWLIGVFFTLGFTREEPNCFQTLLIWFFWPIFLGNELRQVLSKDDSDVYYDPDPDLDDYEY